MAMGQAEQNPDLPSLASNVLGKVQSHLNSLTELRGKLKCRQAAGQVNFTASLPSSENNVLQHILHPVHAPVCQI